MISKKNSVSKGRRSGVCQKVSAHICSTIVWKSFADMVLWMMYSCNVNALVGNSMPSLHHGHKTHGRTRKGLAVILWVRVALSLLAPVNECTIKDFLSKQLKSLSKNVQLKGYQLLGVNWLHLLYKKGWSCILADKMGIILTLWLYCLCLP